MIERQQVPWRLLHLVMAIAVLCELLQVDEEGALAIGQLVRLSVEACPAAPSLPRGAERRENEQLGQADDGVRAHRVRGLLAATKTE